MVLASLVVVGAGCHSNTVTRSFGGDMTIELEKNQKLVNVTWKQTSLWVLTREARNDEKPETYKFKEMSEFGFLDGTVTLNEH